MTKSEKIATGFICSSLGSLISVIIKMGFESWPYPAHQAEIPAVVMMAIIFAVTSYGVSKFKK